MIKPLVIIWLITSCLTSAFAIENISDTREQCLTNSKAESRYASYSPDGKKIVFESNRSGSWGIYLMDADGSNTKALSKDGGDQRRPSWHPNGEQIIFESIKDGKTALRTLHVANTEQTVLQAFDNSFGDPMFARYSPDGSEISISLRHSDEKANIGIFTNDGTFKQLVTELETRNFFSQWSPDSQSLIFHSRMYSNNEDDEIVLWDRSDNSFQRLTNWPTHNFCPAWSRDGTKIAFAQSMPNSRPEIFIMNIDGSEKTRVTENEDGETLPSWAADGKSLLVTAYRQGHYQICSIKLAE